MSWILRSGWRFLGWTWCSGCGKNTVDASVNGVGAEFKSPLSPHRNTVIRRITAKRHKQGPRFVLDMSRSSMTFDEAWSIATTLASRYREDGVLSILVIKQMPDGDVLSGIVGEAVPEWRM